MYKSNMAGAWEDNSDFSFNTAVRGFHIYHWVWLPHFGHRVEREHDRWRLFCNRQHGDMGADDNKPIVIYNENFFVTSVFSIFSYLLFTPEQSISLILNDRINNHFLTIWIIRMSAVACMGILSVVNLYIWPWWVCVCWIL